MSPKIRLLSFLLLFCLLSCLDSNAQSKLPFFAKPDTLHKTRFWVAAGTGTAIYTTASIGLWEAWYKNYELSSFHFFDDRGEWEDMDKAGHFFTAYNEARWAYNGAKWAGLPQKKSVWVGSAIGFGLQATIEVMDGFSKKWGFSLADIGMNTLGVATFAVQEWVWEEQRIVLKVSSNPGPYSTAPILGSDDMTTSTIAKRAGDLYGNTFAESFLKDYNRMTIWASGNVHSFLPNRKDSKFPKWLNIAVGYGAENMFGGYSNSWSENEVSFNLASEEFPRYQQFFLSLDVDLTRIKTKNRTLKAIFSVINFIKIPAPTLEINTNNGIKFHPIYW